MEREEFKKSAKLQAISWMYQSHVIAECDYD
jgi:hypothetical protein